MGEQTGIGWTEATWNPWHGCHKISAECDNCYMFTEKKQYGQDGDVVLRSKTKFNDPLKWVRSGKPPKMCFTCSWSDWFIREADPWRGEAWTITRHTPQITYQILTKRIGRAIQFLPLDWGEGYPNIWMGVSVGLKATRQRISGLRAVPARTKFVSFEPLLEDLGDLNLSGIDWAIIGGESGHRARPMEIAWARNVKEQCVAQGVKVFMKQLGGRGDKRADLVQFPTDLQIREYPA
jgi:protein gp37